VRNQEEIITQFGNQLRLRVSGICLQAGKLLMIKHRMPNGWLWAPPGGGLQFGEEAKTCLKREFKEETNLSVEVGDFLFVNEFLEPPLHALELFFRVEIQAGELQLGSDPEMSQAGQIIKQVTFLDTAQLMAIPPKERHRLFRQLSRCEDILSYRGFYAANDE